jgi:DNA transposition AAA+ family ATPase
MNEEPKQPDERAAIERLNESNRHLLEAGMMPANQLLTEDQIKSIRTRVAAYLEKHGISLTVAAMETGYGIGTVSPWMKAKYKGDNDAVARAFNNWMERDARRRTVSKPADYISTFAADSIATMVSTADQLQSMAVIVAPSGTGKTMVAKALCEDMRGIYLSMSSAISDREFLLELAEALGKSTAGRWTRAALLRFAVGALKGTKRIIFIDEAHQLRNAIGMVRTIHDKTGCCIVMLGTADVLELVNDRFDGKGQFSSRTIRANLLDFVSNADDPEGGKAGRDLFTIKEIKEFFARKKMRLADDGLRMMWLLACLPNHGCLRLIGYVADVAQKLCGIGQELSRADLMSALATCIGGEARHVRTILERAETRVAKAKVA